MIMEQHVFVYYKNKLIEGNSEGVYRILLKNDGSIKILTFLCV